MAEYESVDLDKLEHGLDCLEQHVSPPPAHLPEFQIQNNLAHFSPFKKQYLPLGIQEQKNKRIKKKHARTWKSVRVYISKYSQLSVKGHSHKPTALLADIF